MRMRDYSWICCGHVTKVWDISRHFSQCYGSVNMAAPLPQRTVEQQRAVLRFLLSEGVSGAEIHRRLVSQFKDNALHRANVYRWIDKFKSGRTSVTPKQGAGRPSTSTTDEKIQQAQQMVMANTCPATFELVYPPIHIGTM